MATSPRLKYPFVAGMGMTVYLVTANVTAAKIAAAASSRVLTISSSLVCGFAQKQKDARTRASWGHSGADPPQPSPHTDLPRSKSAGTGCRSQHLSADLERGLPSTPEFHRATAPAQKADGRTQNAVRAAFCLVRSAFWQGPHGLSPPIGHWP